MAFNPLTSAFTADNAAALFEASALAYEDNAGFKAGIVKTFGQIDDHRLIESAFDTQAHLFKVPDATVIAFRGSQEFLDWLVDLDALAVRFVPEGAAHQGFMNSIWRAYPAIHDAIAQSQGERRSLWLTGHSLGGALAQLCAALFTIPQSPNVSPSGVAGVYTFGQPRVGDRLMAGLCDEAFGKVHFRVVNGADIVTRLPPRQPPVGTLWPIPSYQHAGREVRIGAGGIADPRIASLLDQSEFPVGKIFAEILRNPFALRTRAKELGELFNAGTAKARRLDLLKTLGFDFGPEPILDHLITSYRAALAEAIRSGTLKVAT
ncbi:lipase family protein [Prosthecodimorpha staleyi]|uniref:Lipase family protein n=1 Tax=Prosthecodimorpha staleyi TaxID=2840188 RepID=A0A947GG31_9HYPH|nr:lipase family protein [Prosthecodimorpha staleyi]MBT9291425.1 lipase family protein [Prosthecodimorpha staleyi]